MARSNFRADSNLDTYGTILAVEQQVKDNEEKINDNLKERQRLLLSGISAEDERIKQLDKENEKYRKQNAELGAILNEEDVQTYKQNSEQIVDNTIEMIASGQSDAFNELGIYSVDNLITAIESGRMGDELMNYYNTIMATSGEEAAHE